jgi:ligand-binding sensor domain-containing protein/signal transduction histidine kinase
LSRIIFFFIAVLLSSITLAQTEKQYSFTHYTTGSGLISNQVNSILQDEQGYIWLATTDGLQRFDGVRYKTFRHDPKDPSSIPSNFVGQLIFGPDKNLWMMLSEGQVCIFNTKTFVFKKVPVKTKKEFVVNGTARALMADEYGNMFLGVASSEILTYNAKTNEFSYKNTFIKHKDEWNICSFAQQPGTHKYWLSIVGVGLAIYDHATGTLSYPGNNVAKEPAIEQHAGLLASVGLFFDKKQRLWFINWNPAIPVIYCYDTKTNHYTAKGLEFYSYLNAYHEVYGFFEQQDGTIWVRGIPVFAKYLEDKNSFELVNNGYQNEQGIAYSAVMCLYEDREKNIWVCTDNNGLFRFNPSTEIFTNVNHINRANLKKGVGDPMSFIKTKWGTILAGTWGDGMYEYDDHFKLIPFTIKAIGPKVNPFAWSMILSKDSNTIWISSQPGIYRINQDERSYKYYNPPLLQSRTVRQVAEDKNGDLWLGMQSTGVFKWDAEKGKNNFDDGISKFTAIPDCMVGRITVDSKGLVWIATNINGAYVIEPNTGRIVMHFSITATGEQQLPEAGVSYIGEYDDSTMLISTSSYLIAYNRISKHTTIVATPETISGYTCSFQVDKNRFVWLATSNGLYRINIQKGVLVNFNRADGIENEKFNGATSYRLPDGRMLFGTTSNFVAFDPVNIKINTAFADVSITGFKIDNKSYRVDSLLNLKEIELDYKENSLIIEFSSLLYNNASLIKYKLDKLDKDWIVADKNYTAIYNYLPPGDYLFMLKTINANGKETPKLTQLHIKINAPFWKTWWFFSLDLLLIALLLFVLDRQRTKRKEGIQKMRSELADNLHSEVNIALSNINILSEMGKLKADKDPQKSKEFIEQIHTKSQNMMIAMDDMLWTINPANDSMAKVIERMKEHIGALRIRYEIGIDLQVEKKVEDLKLNMKLRQHIFWFLKSGSTNIVKTGAKDCYIHVGLERTNLIYTFEFDSSSSDLQQLNNLLQRHELTQKIEEARASFDFKLQNSRSRIELIMPIQ